MSGCGDDSLGGPVVAGGAHSADEYTVFDEFESDNAAGANRYWLDWRVITSGTAGAAVASIPGVALHPGIVRLSTGTVPPPPTGGRAEIVQLLTARLLAPGMTMSFEAIVRVPVLQGANTYVVEFGLADTF